MKRDRVLIATLIAAVTSYMTACTEEEKKTAPTAPSSISSAATTTTPASTSTSAPATGGLSLDEQREFYHLSEGGELLPLDAMRAVESSVTGKPFMEDIARFGLIPDPGDPDGLPVGMSVAMVDGKRAVPRMVFFNCAGCHVAEVTYQGKSLRVDGAPAHSDIAGLIIELLASFDATLTAPKKLAGFVERLGEKHLADAKAAGKAGSSLADKVAAEKLKIDSAAASMKLLKEKLVYLKRLRALRVTVPGGYGRLDAFVAARNLLWGDKYPMDVSSPVSLPPIFGLSRLSWFHYDNNTTSFIQRNIGEDLGMGAVLDPKTGESEVKVRNLYRLEQLVAKLPVPKWPEAMLGKLDAAKVARGAPIYKKECASCHDLGPDGKFPDLVTDLATVGTDPNRLTNFNTPVGDKLFSDALGEVLALAETKAFEREKVTPEEAAKMEPRKVVWRSSKGYSSRPIDGVWATAPYLHNGSVPTLYDLLLPQDKRPATFKTGSHEYDPKKVGYVSDGSNGGTFNFDTSANGNKNTGHTWGTTLSEEDRWALVEYLKSR